MVKKKSLRRNEPEIHPTPWMVKDKLPIFQFHLKSLSHAVLLSNAKGAAGLPTGWHLVWMQTATVESSTKAMQLSASSILVKSILFSTEGIQTTVCLSTSNSTHKLSGSVLDFICLLLRVEAGQNGCLQTSEDEKIHRIHEQGRGCSIQVSEPRSTKQDFQRLTMSIALKILNMGEKKTCHVISGGEIIKTCSHLKYHHTKSHTKYPW